MSKYKQLISVARKTENQKTREPDTQHEVDLEVDVNLSIKVPKFLRQHWAAEAKRQGTTLKAAITDSLNAKFGKPK